MHARRSLAGLALLVALPALRCWGCVGRRRGRVPRSVVWVVWGHRPRSSRGHPAPVGGSLAWFSLSASYINEKVMQTAWRCLSEPLAPHVIRTGLICLTRSQRKFPMENKNCQSSQGTVTCKGNIQSFKCERESLICKRGGFKLCFCELLALGRRREGCRRLPCSAFQLQPVLSPGAQRLQV